MHYVEMTVSRGGLTFKNCFEPFIFCLASDLGFILLICLFEKQNTVKCVNILKEYIYMFIV